MTKIVIDADPLIYKAGSIRKVKLSPHKKDGIYMVEFDTDKDIDTLHTGYLFKPLADCEDYLENYIENILDATKATDARIFLSPLDKSNYRYNLCKYQQYKANRADVIKPRWFKELRDYLIKEFDAEVAHKREADDCCGELASTHVICSNDKDLLYGVPGNKFNYDTFKKHHTSELDAFKFFCQQLLTGDAADNVKGLYGWGEKKATEYLEKCKAEDKELAKAVYKKYKECFSGLHPTEIEARLVEASNLLWIQQERKLPINLFLD